MVAPGADPNRIRLLWHGALDAYLDEARALVLRTPLGELRETTPVAWQEQAGGWREPVAARWAAGEPGPDGEPTWGIVVGEYDPNWPLTIDPDVLYGCYLGGGGSDGGQGVAVDGTGAAYVVGTTSSPDFAIGGAPGFDRSFTGGVDAFAVKLAPDGRSLIYSTY